MIAGSRWAPADAEQVDADVERHLGAVEAKARGERGLSGAWLVAAAAIVSIALLVRVGGQRGEAPAVGASPAASPPAVVASPSGPVSYPQIAGTYTVTLDPSDPAVARDGLGGSWTMRLQPDGLVLLSPPSTYAAGSDALTGVAFSLEGDRFRTNLFYNDACNAVGTYTWSLQGGRLALRQSTTGVRSGSRSSRRRRGRRRPERS